MAGNQSKSGPPNKQSLARRLAPDAMIADDYLHDLLKTIRGLRRAAAASPSIGGKMYAAIRAEEKRG